VALFQRMEKILYNTKPKKIMGYYRKENEKPSDDGKDYEVKLDATMLIVDDFNELPEEIYSELMQRTLRMAERMSARQEELETTFSEIAGVKGINKEAYWKTSLIEQVAFLEMQITNMGIAVHHLTNKQ